MEINVKDLVYLPTQYANKDEIADRLTAMFENLPLENLNYENLIEFINRDSFNLSIIEPLLIESNAIKELNYNDICDWLNGDQHFVTIKSFMEHMIKNDLYAAVNILNENFVEIRSICESEDSTGLLVFKSLDDLSTKHKLLINNFKVPDPYVFIRDAVYLNKSHTHGLVLHNSNEYCEYAKNFVVDLIVEIFPDKVQKPSLNIAMQP